ncbi:hypothetical protein C0581_00450 [Candidatus Parcubacteria bacterium]|nr:MAG: hypothetical protein C0581_00450 [Candidatus Parcubacteria bacterium]
MRYARKGTRKELADAEDAYPEEWYSVPFRSAPGSEASEGNSDIQAAARWPLPLQPNRRNNPVPQGASLEESCALRARPTEEAGGDTAQDANHDDR